MDLLRADMQVAGPYENRRVCWNSVLQDEV